MDTLELTALATTLGAITLAVILGFLHMAQHRENRELEKQNEIISTHLRKAEDRAVKANLNKIRLDNESIIERKPDETLSAYSVRVDLGTQAARVALINAIFGSGAVTETIDTDTAVTTTTINHRVTLEKE